MSHVSKMLVAGFISSFPVIAQQAVVPRPMPEPSPEQQEIADSVKLRNHCSPRYPDSAAAAQQEGWVIVEFTISTAGEALDPRVFDSSPRDIFNDSALEAISRCLFAPKIVDGEAVEIDKAQFRMIFEL